jgi:hypothetical protein
VSGTLTFGIATQADNALGSAVILTPDDNGNINATYQNNAYPAFIDSGSNALFFLTSATTGLPACSFEIGFYCPSSSQTLTATNSGTNGASSTFSFSVESADVLLNSSNDAFSDIAGPEATGTSLGNYFDWGLPFFFGRNIFVAIEGQNAGGTGGPYWAY